MKYLLALVLFFYISKNNAFAQKLIKIIDNTNGKEYFIKAGVTSVNYVLAGTDGSFADKIDSTDEAGIYFKNYPRIEFQNIKSINFKPFYKAVRAANVIYYTGMLNLTLFGAFLSYDGSYGSGNGIVIMIITSPIWGILIPGAANFIVYSLKPRIFLKDISAINFQKVE